MPDDEHPDPYTLLLNILIERTGQPVTVILSTRRGGATLTTRGILRVRAPNSMTGGA